MFPVAILSVSALLILLCLAGWVYRRIPTAGYCVSHCCIQIVGVLINEYV